METTPRFNLEVTGVESQVGPPDCLCNPVVLRRILEHFSDSELLQLSLVNKEWNFEARSVLRNRGNLIVKEYPGDLCQHLVALASDLKNMRVVPFSGIQYTIWHRGRCEASHGQSLDPSCNVILDRLQWKQIKVSLDELSENTDDCAGLALLKKVLDGYSDALEKVSLFIDGETGVWFQRHLPNWSFSRLQILELDGNCTEESSRNLIKALVASASNLRELKLVKASNFMENVLEGSSAVLVPYDFRPLYQQVCESLMGSFRPETIKIYVADTEDYERELLNGFVPKVLHASHTSLKRLGMDLLFAVPLMCYGICLESVTTLKIRTCRELLSLLEPPISTIVTGFDFTRIFPKLTQVRVLHGRSEWPARFIRPPRRFFSVWDILGFVEQGNAVLRKTLPDRAINIKQLALTKSIWEFSLHFWAQMFPHLKTLSLVTDGRRFPFDDLLEYFGDLEELIVEWDNENQMEVGNLDSAICGIFPAELNELRGKDDEYLKAVNIVPVKPSISCMRGLRSLTCKYTPKYDDEKRTDSTLIFSKVTAWIGFARCPSLTVTMVANSKTAEGLRHMEPYVTFIVTDTSIDYESDDNE